jgi:hypothetical protein
MEKTVKPHQDSRSRSSERRGKLKAMLTTMTANVRKTGESLTALEGKVEDKLAALETKLDSKAGDLIVLVQSSLKAAKDNNDGLEGRLARKISDFYW